MLNQPDTIRLSRGPRADREITTFSKRRPTITLFDRYIALVLTRAFRVHSVGRDHVIRNLINALRITLGSSQANRSIIKLDIEECFKNIDHEILMNKLGSHAGVPRFVLKHVASVLNSYERIYGQRRGLPQGVPSSSVLAEIYFEKFDNRLRQHPRTVLYARYVDDIVIVCHGNEIVSVQETISEQLGLLKFKINELKSEKISHPSDINTDLTYLGYTFAFNAGSGQLQGIDISEDKFNRYEMALCRLEQFGKNQVCWSRSQDVDLFLGGFEYLIYQHHSKGDEDSPRIVTGLGYSARYVLQVNGSMPRVESLIKSAFHRSKPILGSVLRGNSNSAICPCCGGPVVRADELMRIQRQKSVQPSKILASNAKPHLDDEMRLRIQRLLWN
nr:reverse transcriptase domain-containing protein [Arthrobacter sp. SDTb3-6]